MNLIIMNKLELLFFLEIVSQNVRRRPIWMTENHFRSHFSPFQINMQISFFEKNSTKCRHFGWPKITFDRISRHFRSICKFHFSKFFPQNGRRRTFWITENHFRSHFSPFQINMLLIFFGNFATKCPPAAILDYRKSLSIAFLATSDEYATFIFLKFFPQNGRRGHFGWPKITFDHISRHFQINTQLSFFLRTKITKWPPAAILDDRKSLLIAFLAISDQYATFLIFFFKMAVSGHFGCPVFAKIDRDLYL